TVSSYANSPLFLSSHTPPRATLFPYTPLFRSSRRPGAGRPALLQDHTGSCTVHRPSAHERCPPAAPRARRLGRGTIARTSPRSSDRKSTRLNSSHVKSSYAVFCLKKKNQTFIS